MNGVKPAGAQFQAGGLRREPELEMEGTADFRVESFHPDPNRSKISAA